MVSLEASTIPVVAGSVALGFGAPFFEAANEELRGATGLDYTAGATIVPAGLGADGPLVGAARVAFAARERQAVEV